MQRNYVEENDKDSIEIITTRYRMVFGLICYNRTGILKSPFTIKICNKKRQRDQFKRMKQYLIAIRYLFLLFSLSLFLLSSFVKKNIKKIKKKTETSVDRFENEQLVA
ncbi:hypothetical protein PUN28_001954 [Cardiocondyla obscurior]|uniref:Transmembrane protein n=1 Tax=Cardiocondyla obscurior TaxID=286306 RepID=A0AAW2GRZ6_9HYME